MKISSMRILLTIMVLQAVLVSAAVATTKGHGEKKKPCCTNCVSWSGVYTCDDLLTKCGGTSCKNCAAVPTDKGTRYMCRDIKGEGCGCKTN